MMLTCNRLDLQTLGSQPDMPKKSPQSLIHMATMGVSGEHDDTHKLHWLFGFSVDHCTACARIYTGSMFRLIIFISSTIHLVDYTIYGYWCHKLYFETYARLH